jgi:hypothetical protein
MYGDSLKQLQLRIGRAGEKQEMKESSLIIVGCLLIFRRIKGRSMIRPNIRKI